MTTEKLRRDLVLMVALLGGFLVATLLFGERVLSSDGLGPDGAHFARSAFDPWRAIVVEGVDPYYLQRMLPGAVVHVGLWITGTPRDLEHVILGFAVLDIVLLLLSVFLWIGIAEEFAISSTGRWLGFIGLFVNYAVLKHALYVPVMTEVMAFALGLAMLYLYLRNWSVALACVAFVGAFAWPVTAASAVPLILWPRQAVPAPDRTGTTLGTVSALLLAGAMVAAFLYMFVIRGIRTVGAGPIVPIVTWAAPLAATLYGAHIYSGVRALAAGVDLSYVRRALASLTPPRLALALTPLLVSQLVTRLLASGVEPQSLRGFLRFVVFLPNTRPYLFMVAHLAWFGAGVLLLMLYWSDICRAAWRFGPGLPALLLCSLLIALTPEARQSTLAWPMFAVLATWVVQERGWSSGANWAMGAVALALSKIWLTLNTPEAIAYGGDLSGLTREMAVRLYYPYLVSHGPLMPNAAYVIQAAVFVVLLLSAWFLLRARAWPARSSRWNPYDASRPIDAREPAETRALT